LAVVVRVQRFAWFAVLALVAAVASGGCTDDSKKLAIGMPAYVRPGDPLFDLLLDPSVDPPEWVILNLDNGDGDMTPLDTIADFLTSRRTSTGQRVKVLGYVWTSDIGKRDELGNYDFSNRPEQDIVRSIDDWLLRPDGIVHYDGVFFDVASPICEHRDKFLRLKAHVQQRSPLAQIVHNPGVAVHSCYLEPGKRTADIFATFEGSEQVYFTPPPTPGEPPPAYGYWLGGNVSNQGRYVDGHELTFTDEHGADYRVTISRDSYWHLLYNATPGREEATVGLARDRYAGVLTASTAVGPPFDNPWRLGPGGADHLRAMQQHLVPTTTSTASTASTTSTSTTTSSASTSTTRPAPDRITSGR
jgi:hypothetical protein